MARISRPTAALELPASTTSSKLLRAREKPGKSKASAIILANSFIDERIDLSLCRKFAGDIMQTAQLYIAAEVAELVNNAD
jgi:hypothetical protein